MRKVDHKELQEVLKDQAAKLIHLQHETHMQWDLQILALSSVAIWFTADYVETLPVEPLLPLLAVWAICLFVASIILTLIGFSISADHLELLLERNGEEFALVRNVESLLKTGRGEDELKAAALKLAFPREMEESTRRIKFKVKLIRHINKARMLAFIAGALCALALLVLNSAIP